MKHLKYRLNIAKGFYEAIQKGRVNKTFWEKVTNFFQHDSLIEAYQKIDNRFK
jgi:hypothetical protein